MDLDDVGIAFGLAVVQMLGQVPLGQDLAGVQHEIAQQAEFGGGQVDVGAFRHTHWRCSSRRSPAASSWLWLASPWARRNRAWMRKASSSGWNGLVR